METELQLLEALNDYGIWSILSLLVQLTIVILGLVYIGRRKRVPNLNFTFAVVEGNLTDRTNSSRQLQILIRNLSGMDVLVGAATFSTRNRKTISEYADGDSASNEYELKFQPDDGLFSDAFTLIKSTHHETTWVPLNEEMDIQKQITEITGNPLRRSYFQCQVILLTRRPETIRCRIPVINIQHRAQGLYITDTQ